MDLKYIITYLENLVLSDKELSDETKNVLTEVIKKLKAAKTREQILEALNLITTLLGIGSKFFP